MDSTTKPNLAFRILKRISGARIIPRNPYFKLINGVAWIIEGQLEIYFGGIFISRYLWEILGPVNTGLFLSAFFATLYGAICLFFGAFHFAKQFSKRYQEVRI